MAEIELPHGTRRTYQRYGCTCTPCKAANAAYSARLRARRAKGLPILGSHASAATTWRRIRSLRIEGLSRGEIAARLGLRTRKLQFDTERITLRTVLRVHRLHRSLMSDELNSLDFTPNASRRTAPQLRAQEGQ